MSADYVRASLCARWRAPRTARALAEAIGRGLTLLLLISPCLIAAASASAEADDPRVIRVSGEATASTPPDRVIVELAVVTERDRAADAVEENANRLAAVFQSLRKAVGKKGRIETASYSLSPRYRYLQKENRQELVGYTARNVVRVVLDDVDRVGAVLDRATAAGANEVQRLAFVLKDDTEQRDEALRAASQRALAKARTIAGALGLEIDGVRSVDETTRVIGPARTEQFVARAMAETPIAAPGSVEVRAQVDLTVGIR
jgi:uncharacterized protein YggE